MTKPGRFYIPNAAPRIRTIDTSCRPPPEKTVDSFYHSPEYLEWREAVIARAGRQCEAREGASRCTVKEPAARLYADHVKEIKDGGAKLDTANGQALCAKHHAIKTAKERAKRFAQRF